MTIEEFLILDIEARAEAVWNKGIFVDTFVSQTNSYALYSLFSFYAEMNIDRGSFQIVDVSPLSEEEYKLEKYLDKIKLDSLNG